MKFCILLCLLSVPSLDSPHVAQGASEGISSFSQTLTFNESTVSLQLNCTCTNQLTQWIVNGSLCKAFLDSDVIYEANSSSALCAHCNRSSLVLYPPFSSLTYVCIGAGAGASCHHRWFVTAGNPLNLTTANLTARLLSERPADTWYPLFTLFAFISLVAGNFALLTYLAY